MKMNHLPDLSRHKYYRLYLLLLLILICIPLFACLGTVSIRKWDEGRLVANALEMYHNRNYWVTYCYGEPDMWNTKPPLLIWIQVFFLHLFGYTEWAVRLPSAIAALLTCILIFRFIARKGGSVLWAILTVFILITTTGFVGMHVSRTGDYDALLVLWLTLAGISFWEYTETRIAGRLYLCFGAMGLAVLTKSAAGLMLVPCMFAYAVLSRQLWSILRSRHFYGGVVLFLLLALPYYFIREHYNPGYIRTVNDNEWIGRYFKANENNGQPWSYYLKLMVQHAFAPWYVLILPGLWLMGRAKPSVATRVLRYSALMGIGFFLVVSAAETKLLWYVAPAYPFLAVLAAYVIMRGLELLYHPSVKHLFRRLGFVLCFLFFAAVYVDALIDNEWRKENALSLNIYNSSNYIRDRFLKQDTLKTIILHDEPCYPQVLLYMYRARTEGYWIFDSRDKQIAVGDYVLTENPDMERSLQEQYTLEKVDEDLGAHLWLCTGLRHPVQGH